MKSKNYFNCIMQNRNQKPCEQDLIGGTNCSGCIANMACEACGRKDTEFCEACTNEEKDVKE